MKEIDTEILSPANLAEKIKEVKSKPNPNPSPATKKAWRWTQGIIKNCTQFELRIGHDAAYFAHGKYETSPVRVPPFSIGQFSAVSTSFAHPWAAGGNSFVLYIERDADINIVLGFTAPFNKSFKSAIVESKKSYDGWAKTQEGGNAVNFKEEFTGNDDQGESVTVHFEGSASGGQSPVFTITQKVMPTHGD